MPKLPELPKGVMPALVLLTTLALVPPLLIAKARSTQFREPRVHLIPDMDHQFKYRTQAENALFADGRAMRLPVEGTVARGELADDSHRERGKVNGQWATQFPMPVTQEVMQRGQERYNIYCAPCHGLDGLGRGSVALRAETLQEAKWIPPTSFHTDIVRDREVGNLYNTITNGIRNMPAYGSQVPVDDRWAIVAYVRALQRSQGASIDDVPADRRGALR